MCGLPPVTTEEYPPWAYDEYPHAWVKIAFAARHYFRKHPNYIRMLAREGDLPNAARYRGEWFVRLPEDCVIVRKLALSPNT